MQDKLMFGALAGGCFICIHSVCQLCDVEAKKLKTFKKKFNQENILFLICKSKR